MKKLLFAILITGFVVTSNQLDAAERRPTDTADGRALKRQRTGDTAPDDSAAGGGGSGGGGSGNAAGAASHADSCGICHSDLSTSCKLYTKKKVSLNICRCRYTYHQECINTWLMRNPSCPFCRKEIISSSVDGALGLPVPSNNDEEQALCTEVMTAIETDNAEKVEFLFNNTEILQLFCQSPIGFCFLRRSIILHNNRRIFDMLFTVMHEDPDMLETALIDAAEFGKNEIFNLLFELPQVRSIVENEDASIGTLFVAVAQNGNEAIFDQILSVPRAQAMVHAKKPALAKAIARTAYDDNMAIFSRLLKEIPDVLAMADPDAPHHSVLVTTLIRAAENGSLAIFNYLVAHHNIATIMAYGTPITTAILYAAKEQKHYTVAQNSAIRSIRAYVDEITKKSPAE